MYLDVGRSGIRLQLESGFLLFKSVISLPTSVWLQIQDLFDKCPWQTPARCSVLSNEGVAELVLGSQRLSRALIGEPKGDFLRRQGVSGNQVSRNGFQRVLPTSLSPLPHTALTHALESSLGKSKSLLSEKLCFCLIEVSLIYTLTLVSNIQHWFNFTHIIKSSSPLVQ